MDIIFITNCCLGYNLNGINQTEEYNNPFISTLILEDSKFIKLCENLKYYINCEPICDYNLINTTEYYKQTNSVWYKNDNIRIPYPIIHLEDIEIHCIHEDTIPETLSKFKRRLERLKNILNKNNYNVFNILTYSTLFIKQSNDDYKQIITNFLNNNKIDININFIFLGPINYIKNDYYISDDFFNPNIVRRIDNVNIQIDFCRESSIILNHLKILSPINNKE